MVWHGHILSSDIGLVFGLVLSHRPGNPTCPAQDREASGGERHQVYCLSICERRNAHSRLCLATLSVAEGEEPEGLWNPTVPLFIHPRREKTWSSQI